MRYEKSEFWNRMRAQIIFGRAFLNRNGKKLFGCNQRTKLSALLVQVDVGASACHAICNATLA